MSDQDVFSSMLGASEAETVKILIDLVAVMSNSGAVALEDIEAQLARTHADIETRQPGIPTAKYKALLRFIEAMKEAGDAKLS